MKLFTKTELKILFANLDIVIQTSTMLSYQFQQDATYHLRIGKIFLEQVQLKYIWTDTPLSLDIFSFLVLFRFFILNRLIANTVNIMILLLRNLQNLLHLMVLRKLRSFLR